MNNDICSFGKEFEELITTCREAEDKAGRESKEIESKEEQLHYDWEERINKLKGMRLKKIKEINDELEKTKLKLRELEREASDVLHNYCYRRNKHSYILSAYKYEGLTGETSFGAGVHIYKEIYKCSVCGNTCDFSVYRHRRTSEYKQDVPQEAYDDESISVNGKTYRMLKEEIDELKTYIGYLGLLKEKMCELFGHDVTPEQYKSFKCKCCGKYMEYDEYVLSYNDVRYKGVVDFYCGEYPCKAYYVTGLCDNLDLSLPTYESYKETILSKRQKEAERAEKKEGGSCLTRKAPWQ